LFVEEATYEVFRQVDMRVGRVLRAEPFAEARKPAYKLWIDFGELGERQTSAQLTTHYAPEDLVGRQVVAVVNFPAKRIAGFISQVLVLGGDAAGGGVVLLAPDQELPPGTRIY
jgi:tRNA-binding protein